MQKSPLARGFWLCPSSLTFDERHKMQLEILWSKGKLLLSVRIDTRIILALLMLIGQ